MRKQLLMSLTILSLFVTFGVVSTYAQSNMRLTANIPFEFSVGNKVLPAGEYTVTYIFEDVAQIRSEDCSESQSFFTIPAQAGARRNESSLVFHRYGDQYFLSTIWAAGYDTGRELRKPDAERELIRARSAVAKGASESQIVSIVARLQ